MHSYFIIKQFSLCIGLLSGFVMAFAFALLSGYDFAFLREFNEGGRVLLQEHSLILSVIGLPGIVGGWIALRLGARKWVALGSLLWGIAGMAATGISLITALLSIQNFESRMITVLGQDYVQVANQASVRLRETPYDFSSWLNILTGQPSISSIESEYRKIGDQSLMLDIYQPSTPGSHPILVLIHGGGLVAGEKRNMRAWGSYFAHQGYLVIAPQYRFLTENSWPAPLEDIICALGWFQQHASYWGGNPGWMGLVGFSSGGQLALLASVHAIPGQPWDDCPTMIHPVRAVVTFGAVTTPDFYSTDWFGEADIYNSPLKLAQEHFPFPPIMLIHGREDEVVNVQQTDQFQAILSQTSSSIYLDPSWSGHIFQVLPGGLATQITGYYVELFLAWTQVMTLLESQTPAIPLPRSPSLQ